MAPLSKVWAVRDPTPKSELADVLFELDLSWRFTDYLRGAELAHGPTIWRDEHTALYLDEAEARQDAERRFKAQAALQAWLAAGAAQRAQGGA